MMLNPLAPMLEGLRLASSTTTICFAPLVETGAQGERPGVDALVSRLQRCLGRRDAHGRAADLPSQPRRNSRSTYEGATVADGRVEFQQVWKKFRRGELHDSLRDLVPAPRSRLFRRTPRARRAQRAGVLGGAGRLVLGAARGGARHHRPERRRQVDHPQAADPDPAADAGPLRHPRPRRRADRDRRRAFTRI